MPRFTIRLFVCLLTFAVGSLRAADWSQLKLGMTSESALRILGEPIMKSSGQGFEIWIYDDQAEAVFYGPLVGWTSPRTDKEDRQHRDVWQATTDGKSNPVVLPRPVKNQPGNRRTTERATGLQVYR